MQETTHDQEPIVALASGSTPSAISILRFSGKDCQTILTKFLRHKVSPNDWKPRRFYRSDFVDPTNGQIIDDVMSVFFAGTSSYTGQESAEIYFHGSPFIISKSLETLYAHGFRAAEPGEFTRRAFQSGKMDLSSAEAIQELISSQSEQQWLAARSLYNGRLADTVNQLCTQVKEALGWLEASIDFPDEGDTQDLNKQEVLKRVKPIEDTLKKLGQSFQSGQTASKGLRVALFGKPNVGKSTLMNALLENDRAIVTDVPGTTRDYLEESCLIDGRLIRLIDTAGIREDSDKVEKIGIERSFEIASKADLILFLHEPNDSPKNRLETWKKRLNPQQYIEIISKIDLQNVPTSTKGNSLRLSCASGEGLEVLRKRLVEAVDKQVAPIREDVFISSSRHKNAVDSALNSISRFYSAYQADAYEEMLAFELRECISTLYTIIGKVDSEDILDVVFGNFCVGK